MGNNLHDSLFSIGFDAPGPFGAYGGVYEGWPISIRQIMNYVVLSIKFDSDKAKTALFSKRSKIHRIQSIFIFAVKDSLCFGLKKKQFLSAPIPYIELFTEIISEYIKPDDVCLICGKRGCNSASWVNIGLRTSFSSVHEECVSIKRRLSEKGLFHFLNSPKYTKTISLQTPYTENDEVGSVEEDEDVFYVSMEIDGKIMNIPSDRVEAVQEYLRKREQKKE